MSKKKELVLSPENNIHLLEAVHLHHAHKKVYIKMKVAKKKDVLTHYFLTAKQLLELHNQVIEIKPTHLNKDVFKEFLKHVKDSYIESHFKEVVANMHAAIKSKNTQIEDTTEFITYQWISASEVVSKLIEKENFKEEVFFIDIYRRQVVDCLMNTLRIGIACRDEKYFYGTPSRYIHNSPRVKNLEEDEQSAMELHLKMVIIHTHLAYAFMSRTPDRIEKYLDAVSEFGDSEAKQEILSQLHGFGVARKAIYLHRIKEIENIVIEFNKAERFGFDTVLKSLLDSIEYCKKNKINTFLSVTNVILNNLLVAAFTNDTIRKTKEIELARVVTYTGNKGKTDDKIKALTSDIRDYLKGYYENTSDRLCAYSINTAIKQALGTMCKYEPDLFKPSVKKEEAK